VLPLPLTAALQILGARFWPWASQCSIPFLPMLLLPMLLPAMLLLLFLLPMLLPMLTDAFRGGAAACSARLSCSPRARSAPPRRPRQLRQLLPPLQL
jgi:hypothetical protein